MPPRWGSRSTCFRAKWKTLEKRERNPSVRKDAIQGVLAARIVIATCADRGAAGASKVRRRRAPRGSSELRPREVAYSQECLERLARILVHSGHSPAALAREFREICSALKEAKDPWDPLQLNYWA